MSGEGTIPGPLKDTKTTGISDEPTKPKATVDESTIISNPAGKLKATVIATPPPPTTPITPPSPKMGTVIETYPGSGYWSAVLGGTPLHDWSGLDPSKQRPISYTNYRSFNPGKEQTNDYNRTKGLTTKFKRGDSVFNFIKAVNKHLTSNGMDTVSYLPSPTDPTKMLSVLENHAHFITDLTKSSNIATSIQSKFDNWDSLNNESAYKFLVNSLDPDLLSTLEETHFHIGESFAMTWIRMFKYIITTSTDHFKILIDEIKAMTPLTYPSQNIEKMAEEMSKKLKELTDGGYYDPELIVDVISCFMKCSNVDSSGIFSHCLNTLHSTAKRVTASSHFLDKPEKIKEFNKSNLDYKSIMQTVCAEYRYLFDKQPTQWEPAKLPKERHALLLTHESKSYGSFNKEGNESVNWKPQDRQGSGGPRTPKHYGNKRNSSKPQQQKQQFNNKGSTGWRATAPKSGEATTKTANGKVYNWCVKCQFWSLNHTTATHTGPTDKSKPAASSLKQANYAIGPHLGAWFANVSVKKKLVVPTPTVTPTVQATIGGTMTNEFWIHKDMDMDTGENQVVVPLLQHKWSEKVNKHMCNAAGMFDKPAIAAAWKSKAAGTTYISPKGPLFSSTQEKEFTALKGVEDSIIASLAKRKTRSSNNSAHPTVTNESARPKAYVDCHCKSCVLKKQLSMTSVLPHSRSCVNCDVPLGIFDVHKPCYCMFCDCRMPPLVETPGLVSKDCKCLYPSSRCKAGNCNYGNNVYHKIVPKPTSSAMKSVFSDRNLQFMMATLDNTGNNICIPVANNQYLNTIDEITAKVASSLPAAFRVEYSKDNSCFRIIWDSGASLCVSPCADDFISIEPCEHANITGLGGKEEVVEGQGMLRWFVHCIDGTLRCLEMLGLYVPTSTVRLLSTSELLNIYEGETIQMDHNTLTLSGNSSIPERKSVLAHHDQSSHLPTTIAYNQSSTQDIKSALFNVMTTVSDSNQNLSAAEKELLRWHFRLGHLSFKKVQHLMRTGVLSSTESARNLQTAACKIASPPKCTACMFAKQTTRPTKSIRHIAVKDTAGILKRDNLLAGQEVSVDHFICSTKGRLFSGFNKGSESTRYCGGCIFVDHASGNMHVEFQSSLSSHATLEAKLNFEKVCLDNGVVVSKYMSDNGSAFTSKEFSDHLSEFQQVSKFAGVGAHHHNALAERGIRTIMSISRAMLLHAAIHWPDVATPVLWPMAVAHAVFLWNHVPNPATGLSAHDVFTSMRWPQRRFHQLHVWGCPAYVLDKTIADGMKIPKWKPRSKRHIYLGKSPGHANNVHLVLNPSTGAITGQFHAVLDDWFATVSSDCELLPNFNSDEWKKLFGESSFQYLESSEDDGSTVGPDTSDVMDHAAATIASERVSANMDVKQPAVRLPIPEPPIIQRTTSIVRTPSNNPSDVPLAQKAFDPSSTTFRRDILAENQVTSSPTSQVSGAPSSPLSETPSPSSTPSAVPSPSSSVASHFEDNIQPFRASSKKVSPSSSLSSDSTSSRPRRNVKPPSRLTYDGSKESFTNSYYSCVGPSAYFSFLTNVLCFKASKKNSDPDILTYDQAMASQEKVQWIESQELEITELENHTTWKEVPIEAAGDTPITPTTWVFRIKRNPDGTFKKFKARICVRGDLEKTIVESFSPVVAYSTVRFFLIMALFLGWDTISIDFANAFVQAYLDYDVFIHIPRGFRSSMPGKSCLKLVKSLYGLRVAPRLFFELCREPLLNLGFVQSEFDQCLFLRHDCVLILFVDDMGIMYKNRDVLETFLNDLKEAGFSFTREESFHDYLGIGYTNLPNGDISMAQPGLIKKIIEATEMHDSNPTDNPVTQQALGSNPEGEDMTDSWNYRSIVGMLLYLTTNTRPDIAFAVSQVARFSHQPKQTHATAVKRIIRYLKGTANQGCIFKKPESLRLEMYVDADFAGLYGVEPVDLPISVKSRTGYVISISECYLMAKSQLQTCISTSTGEAEYVALSNALKTLIPIYNMLKEFIKFIVVTNSISCNIIRSFPTLVHEDNNSALMLATDQRITARTKHYPIKRHWFWSIVKDPESGIKVVKVETTKQQADFCTKGLPTPAFLNNRKSTQGW